MDGLQKQRTAAASHPPPHTVAAGESSPTMSDNESGDDLDIEKTVQRALASSSKLVTGKPIASSRSATECDEPATSSPSAKRRRFNEPDPNATKIVWSSDEAPDATYLAYKNRAATKRKKTAADKKKQVKRTKDAIVGHRNRKLGANGAALTEDTETGWRGKNWGDESDYEGMENTLPEYLQTRRQKFEKNREVLKEGGLRLPPDYDDVYFSDDEKLGGLEERPNLGDAVEPSREYKDIELPRSLGLIPAPIAQYLRDYQVDGVAFLHELFVYQKGGILGDDMGLGKTVQVAAFLTAAFGKTGDSRDGKRRRKMRRMGDGRWYPRALVICPGSLIENWKAELARWGWWEVDAYHGPGKEDVLQAAIAGTLEIMITTYATYKLSKSKVNVVDWDVVIADECHQLKERASETTKAMNEVNALCRIGLTGTAIQNKYEELWTLLNWTNPGRFGPIHTWKESICKPLTVGQSHNATLAQLSKARKTAKKLVENLLPQFFLRRMKSLIAHQLPKKSDKVVFCPLTDTQRRAYEEFLASEMVSFVRDSGEECDCDPEDPNQEPKTRGHCCYKNYGTTKWQALVFPVITTLQKLANHLALLIPQSTDPRDKQQRDLENLQRIVPDRWEELYATRDSILNLADPSYCGKWAILKKLLSFWHASGDKVLVFSHSVKLLKMLKHLFNHTSYNVSYLDGSMTYEERQATVDDFNSNPLQFVFLLSTKAGGVGLNITSANKVVIFDPNWNPSWDLQAQDRAYRIGQTRDVEVFRLVSAGTVEEIVYARQIYKQQQANIGYSASLERRYFKGVQGREDQRGELFGLHNLLSFHADDVVLRDIVNKTNIAEARADVSLLNVDLDLDDDDPLRVDGGNEDAAMSQLAALITAQNSKRGKGKDKMDPAEMRRQAKAKTDAVQAILASAGVAYTHENSEVVGSSKTEARLSRRAQEAGAELGIGGMGEEMLFPDTQQQEMQAAVPRSPNADGNIQYVWQPPKDVQHRQFCTMAKMFGFGSAQEFALVVEGWTQEERRNCLDLFYKKRRRMLSGEGARDDAGYVYPRGERGADGERGPAAREDSLDRLLGGGEDAAEKVPEKVPQKEAEKAGERVPQKVVEVDDDSTVTEAGSSTEEDDEL